jgi:cytochrome c-type protein NapB
MKTTVIALLAAALAAGCANPRPAPVATPAATDPAPDTSLGLAKGSVFDAPTPPAVKANGSAPGELPVLPRAYALAPPRIPHAVGDFLPITPKQNNCLDCHGVKEKKTGEPTPIPPSHYTDFRNSPGQIGSQVGGARYVCVSCHVGKTDAPNLIGNRFRP